MTRLLKLLCVCIFAAYPFAINAQESNTAQALDFASYPCGEHLFNITKSDNKNELFYDAVIKNGKFNNSDPIDIYWMMYATNGQREGMTILEKPQFGINTKTVTAGERYVINVKNKILSSRNINIFLDANNCPRATTVIEGEESLLQHIFINIKPGGGLLPKVEYIDISGISLSAQQKLTDRVYNK